MSTEEFYIGWVSVDGAGSQKRYFAKFAEAKTEADRLQTETDSRVYPDGTINPFAYRHHVVSTVRGIMYRTTPSVRPGTKANA